MHRNSRILITLSLLATLALAQGADARSTSSPTKKPHAGKLSNKKAHKPKRSNSGSTTVNQGGVKISARVEGGSTGDGPLTDSECAELANDINHSLDEMEDALLDGDDTAAQAWSGIANTVADGGLEGGCFFTGIE